MSRTRKIVLWGQEKVGKTTLFKKLIKKYSFSSSRKQLFVSPIVNHAEAEISINNNRYILVDTPTFNYQIKKEIDKEIKKKTEILMDKKNLVIWIVDASKEINNEMFSLAKLLKNVSFSILVINKIDLVKKTKEEIINYFRTLGQNQYCFISASNELNLEELESKLILFSPLNDRKAMLFTDNNKSDKVSLIIFGPPNSGKSTLLNRLLKENRSLVSEIPGTTKEPIFSNWKQNNFEFQLIDTAGITKKDLKKEQLILQKSDLSWAVIDSTAPISKQILQVIHLGEKYQKPLIIIINKCDLLKDKGNLAIREIKDRLKSLAFCPIISISALKGGGIGKLLQIFEEMRKEAEKKFNKRELEKSIEMMLIKNPPSYKKRRLKIYFVKHEEGLVHNFIFFVNDKKLVHFSYQRYIINHLRRDLGLNYLPIKMIFKKSV